MSANLVFSLPDTGPKWFDLITCPDCQFFVEFKEDLKEENAKDGIFTFTCINCGKVFDFVPEVEKELWGVQLAPPPNSMLNINFSTNDELSIKGKEQKKIFVNILKAWRNFRDQNSKDITLTDTIRAQLYESAAFNFPSAFIRKSQEMLRNKRNKEKN